MICVCLGSMVNLTVCVAGIARLCCDTRRHVRSQALTYLQRALLVHDLQTLSAVEWESCFNKVSGLFHNSQLAKHLIYATPLQQSLPYTLSQADLFMQIPIELLTEASSRSALTAQKLFVLIIPSLESHYCP